MDTTAALTFLAQQRQQYISRKLALAGLRLLAGLLVLGAIGYRWPQPAVWVPAAGLGWLLLAWFGRLFWLVTQTDLRQVARHLDRRFPALQESTTLLLKPTRDLTLLEKYQQPRLLAQLAHLPRQALFTLPFRNTGLSLALAGLLAGAVAFGPTGRLTSSAAAGVARGKSVTPALPVAPPALQHLQITVTPPAYTGQPPYSLFQPNIKIAAGARVAWQLTTTRPAAVDLAVNDRKKIRLRPMAGEPTRYRAAQIIRESAFYTIALNGRPSDYYAIEVAPDQAPVIQVHQPQPFVEIQFGQSRRVSLRGIISDDYGLTRADLVATVARGAGEAVTFREMVLPLRYTRVSATAYTVRHTLDLNQLKLTYGDELYFYLRARDNHRQETRTEAFLVQLEDTTVVAAATALTNGINPVPAYFRSQRQLIIDTEKLIREQPTLAAAAFQERAQDLGVDQKILRLRYGKFLGEEFEGTIGPNPAGEAHDHESEATAEPAAANHDDLLNPYIHRHDPAEEVTFFEPAVKAQLKGALAQMWEAELRLRTHRPRQALPYEYRALRLLKAVQQKSRAYVQKTGFDLPPIPEKEKRLTGDLAGVTSVTRRQQTQEKITFPYSRRTLPWLAQQFEKNSSHPRDVVWLQKAGAELAQEILQKPTGVNLRALRDLRLIIAAVQRQQPLCRPCLLTVMAAFEGLLPPAPPKPHAPPAAKNALADAYFRRL